MPSTKAERREWNLEHQRTSLETIGREKARNDKVIEEVRPSSFGGDKGGRGYRGNHRQLVRYRLKKCCGPIWTDSAE